MLLFGFVKIVKKISQKSFEVIEFEFVWKFFTKNLFKKFVWEISKFNILDFYIKLNHFEFLQKISKWMILDFYMYPGCHDGY